jgi:hypothetical protein
MFRRRRIQGLGALLFSVTTLIGLAPHLATDVAPPDPPSARMVAVAPLADEAGFREDLAVWTSARLALLLSRQGVPVVPFPQVEVAYGRQGLPPQPS